MIDLSKVVYHHSPNVSGWRETSKLEEVSWANRTLTVRHSKRGMWNPVVIAADGTQQEATIWIFRFYDNKWHGAGAERLRPSQFQKELGSPFDMDHGWLYDPNRWGDMANLPINPGEVVGFMVTSGDMRGNMNPGPAERSDVRLVKVWGDRLEMVGEVVVPPAPAPTPEPAPVKCECEDLLRQVLAKLDALEMESGPFTLPLPRILGGPQQVQNIILKVRKHG